MSEVGTEATAEDPRLWALPVEFQRGAAVWMNQAVHELAIALHPILAKLGKSESQEAPGPAPSEPPPEASPLYKSITITHEWAASVEDVVDFETDQFLADIYAMADSYGGQLVRGMVEHISEVVEGTENSIDGTGMDFIEVFIESLEAIDMSFDEDGIPQLSLLMHPDQVSKLTPPTPEHEAKISEVLDRRRKEWLDSRHRRDLPGHTE